MSKRFPLAEGVRAWILSLGGLLLGSCASYDVNTLYFTFHTSREALLPELDANPLADTPYVENTTWMVEGGYFRLELGHDTTLAATLRLPAIPEVGETLLVDDSTRSMAWVGRGTRSTGRIGRVIGIPYTDTGGRIEDWMDRNQPGKSVEGKWAVRYRLDWKDPLGRGNWVQGEARILKTRYRTRDDTFN